MIGLVGTVGFKMLFSFMKSARKMCCLNKVLDRKPPQIQNSKKTELKKEGIKKDLQTIKPQLISIENSYKA